MYKVNTIENNKIMKNFCPAPSIPPPPPQPFPHHRSLINKFRLALCYYLLELLDHICYQIYRFPDTFV